MQYQNAKPKRKMFYGWFVVAISVVIMTVSYGDYFSWPVFYVPILDEFGWSRAKTASIFSVASIVYAFASPVSGALFDKFGPRKLFPVATASIAIGLVGSSQANEIWQFYLFFGVFVGFGVISVGFIPFSALIANWFEKKRATAISVSQIGTRDTFLLAPLIQAVVLALGWRNSYLVLAAVTVVIIISLAQFLRARPQDMGLLPDGEATTEEKRDTKQSKADDQIIDKEWASTDWTLLRAMKEYRFWALFVIMFGAGFPATALINHFVALTTDIGFTAMFAAGVLFVYAISATIGRPCGFIADFIGREKAFTIAMGLMFVALPILLVTEDTSTPWMLYLFIVSFGFGAGLYSPVYVTAAADLFQGKQFGTIVGFANIGYGVGAAFATWLYGYIFDVAGTYKLAIIMSIFAVCIMGIALWVAAPRKVRRVVGRAPKTVQN